VRFSIAPVSLVLFLCATITIVEYINPIQTSSIKYDILKFFLVFMIGFSMEHLLIIGTKKEYSQTRKRRKGYLITLLFNNRIMRMSLILAFLLKIVYLLLDILIYKKTGNHILQPPEHIPFLVEILLFVFISPLLIFTYVFNNIWGFNRNLWLVIKVRTDNFKYLFMQQLKLIAFPAIVDFTISLVYLFFSHFTQEDKTSYLIGYLMSLGVLFFSSIYFSLKYPTFISKEKSMKIQTNVFVNIICALLSIGVYILTLFHYYYLSIPAFIFINIIFYIRLNKKILLIHFEERLYLKLFKQ